MRKFSSTIFVGLLLCFFQASAYSYTFTEAVFTHTDSLKAPNDWFLMDPQEDGIIGTSAHKAHEFLKNKQPKQTVVVAVIDSGVDIAHEDLQGKIWVNNREIPGNGIDDDKNGYVDDVHGWNFIGGKDGSHVAEDSHELTREYVRLKAIYGGLTEDDVKKKQRKEFAYWQRIQRNFETDKAEAEMNFNFFQNMEGMFNQAADIVKEHLSVDDFGAAELSEIETEDSKVKSSVGMLMQVFNNIRDDEMSVNEVISELAEARQHFETQVNFAYNLDFDPRHIVGDDPEDYKDRNYGNNDPTGPDSGHGTHVAGIIAADRNNDLGIKGVAEHVLIMPIRAVPDGDERDKDVANAILYAVDNGAHVINMSFGKSYSPGKKAVDRAVKYAERKGVVLVHAAGNSSKETTPTNNFPNRFYEKKGEASNWLEIGASSWLANEELPASFSNFSNTGVDFFAPGVDIYSTMPGGEYKKNSGTSMAAPTVAGVAALLLAYYPQLKPSQIRQILKSTVHDESALEVNKPGAEETVSFGKLSRTGGVVNAYRALQMAESMTR
jgi:subtilisin family serine protease